MIISCLPKDNRPASQVSVIFAITIYSVIFGLRYGVGMDYFNYMENYEYPDTITYSEPGFLFILRSLSSLHLPVQCFFGIIAFAQLFLIYISLKKEKEIYPFLAFSFMGGCIWLTFANGLRQELAFCLFTYSLKFIWNNRFYLYALIILLCTSLHTSAIILLALYPFLYKKQDWFKNIKWQIILLIIALVAMNMNITSTFFSKVESLFAITNYRYYLSDDYSDLLFNESRIGVGFFINLAIEFFIISSSNKTKAYYNRPVFDIMYTLFFVGVLWKYIFWGSQLLQRINYYFYGFEFIIAAFTLSYFSKRNKSHFILLSVLILLVFVATMYRMDENTARYYFYWQQYLVRPLS